MREAVKSKIYYPRTYRHFFADIKKQAVFILLIVTPMLLLLLFGYPELTRILSNLVVQCLNFIVPSPDLAIEQAAYMPVFGEVHYVVMLPTTYPNVNLILINLVITLSALWFFFASKAKGRPVSIYMSMNLLIHLISCIFFLLAADYFPYTAVEYSELYIKQQIGIWLSFIVIAGLITGFLLATSLRMRIAVFFSIILYSFVFGCVRYLTFLIIVYIGSVLYVPILFFMLGPFFDFLYLVFIYCAFVNHIVKKTTKDNPLEVWQWF